MVNERKQRVVRTAILLGTLMLCALLCAQGATQLLASSLLPIGTGKKPPAARARSQASEQTPSPRELAQAVLTRNIFDSQTGAISWDPPVSDMPVVGEDEAMISPLGDPLGEPEYCQGTVRLVASFVVPFLPALSFASLDSNGKTMLYRTGMQIDGNELVGIREHRVFLRPSGRPLCQVVMFKPPDPVAPPPVAAAPAGEPAAPNAKPGLGEDELNQGITQLSDTQYSVTRSLLDKVLGDQAELMRAARVIPYEENGRVIGVKVYGIRRSSMLGRLGIQNGDVLRTINGFDLSSPDSALQAYTKLREMDQFSIAMIRRGSPRTMEYSVK
jgi:general secretion pathway protein C